MVVFFTGDSASMLESFAGYVQVSTNKSATTMEITALVANPVHKVFLNVSMKLRCWLIEIENTLTVFLPVGKGSGGMTRGPRGLEERTYPYYVTGTDSVHLKHSQWLDGSSEATKAKKRGLNQAVDEMLRKVMSVTERCFEV